MTFDPPTLHDGHRWRALRIGLLGGSFNPPHEGHLHIAKLAQRVLHLDAVWWLVTPHNPLKDAADLMNYEERLALCRELTRDEPDHIICDLELHLQTSRTFDTVGALRTHYPETDFVFITGTDNALEFHHWHRWRELLALVPTIHIARPPVTDLIQSCPLRLLATQQHIILEQPTAAPLAPHTSFWLLNSPLLDISSTKIRNFKAL